MSDMRYQDQSSGAQYPVGFFSSQTGLLDVLLRGERPEAVGPESEEPGKAMVRRCLEKDFPHSA
jgi:hypothetical protein